jgi:hypothetical protein
MLKDISFPKQLSHKTQLLSLSELKGINSLQEGVNNGLILVAIVVKMVSKCGQVPA